MAENKKSFVLYADLIKSIEHLTFEEKGILLTHLLEYVNDMNPTLTDRLILTAWKPIELQLKRDLIKFEQVRSKRSEAGKKSAELRALKNDEQISTNPTSVESVDGCLTNPTDNVNDNVNVNDIIYKELLISESWIEINAKNNKTYPDKVKQYLTRFNNNLIAQGDKKNNKSEYQSHFARWLPIEIEKDKKPATKPQPLI